MTITTDGHARTVTSTAATIGALFADQGISFDSDDLVSPRLSTPVTDGLKIGLIRVRHQRTTATEAVPFGTTRRATADLYVGQTKVVTAGHTGTRTAVYDVVVAAGKVTGKNLVSATVTAAPVNQVVAVGTKQRPATTSSGASGGSSSGSSGGGSVGGGVDSLNWGALAQCESGGNPRAVNPAGYYGLYQFTPGHVARPWAAAATPSTPRPPSRPTGPRCCTSGPAPASGRSAARSCSATRSRVTP